MEKQLGNNRLVRVRDFSYCARKSGPGINLIGLNKRTDLTSWCPTWSWSFTDIWKSNHNILFQVFLPSLAIRTWNRSHLYPPSFLNSFRFIAFFRNLSEKYSDCPPQNPSNKYNKVKNWPPCCHGCFRPQRWKRLCLFSIPRVPGASQIKLVPEHIVCPAIWIK